ncbi:tRNA (uridine(54)-C5)-methyltransferase TrmA [Alkalimonas sp. MEB108]|uniref:tRNA/tmRNA (uracil-C(5))-methyltransferase n=1 Tax=Alkalimonas cellulosilytica TaxID=3058395 RepID=A0ABU7J8Y0_9GAMM|nr:tRNA (uridine(54)-C5)-methyltransferase TrmA [Alkalimonas sp. MEB108]MEE2002961.1 tRNA (uridine(54)-C5)-methyltransferase TrmA [Alkalimonas sp. MEB108]
MRPGQTFPEQYEALLTSKLGSVQTLLAPLQPPEVEVFRSPSEHYRLRAEFRIWHEGDDLFHIMFDPATKERVRIDHFPVADKRISNMMPVLLQQLKDNDELRRRLYQIDYLTGLSGELLITLIYKRQLDENWQQAANRLKQQLADYGPVDLIGRARKQKIELDRDYIIEQLQVGQRTLRYQQIENSFTQPNGVVNQHMLSWACDVAKQLKGDLLELYCGNGNFSLALAAHFHQVVATEISRKSIRSAQYNCSLNHIKNVQVLQMSAEDVSAALLKSSQLKQLDLSNLQLNTVLVDPPRAGLDPATVTLVSRFEDILYISCNPETLKTNLDELAKTHSIERFAVFDQFPYTHHLECGVWLRKKAR